MGLLFAQRAFGDDAAEDDEREHYRLDEGTAESVHRDDSKIHSLTDLLV